MIQHEHFSSISTPGYSSRVNPQDVRRSCCAGLSCRGGGVGEERAAAAMRGARHVSTDAVAQRANPDDIIRALFKVRALPLDGIAR